MFFYAIKKRYKNQYDYYKIQFSRFFRILFPQKCKISKVSHFWACIPQIAQRETYAPPPFASVESKDS